MSVKEHAINYLYSKAEADYQSALMSFELLLNNPVGIGDHSTKDFTGNLDQALEQLKEAKDQLEMVEWLEDYFLYDGEQ